MKKIINLAFLVFFISNFQLSAQIDSTANSQQKQIKRIIDNNQQNQQQIQQQVDTAIDDIFGSVQTLLKERRNSRRALNEWYELTLDSIQNDQIDLTIRELDSLRKINKKKIDSIYYSNVEFLYSRNKYKDVRFLPAFNSYMSMLYYNADKKFDFFENTTLSLGDENLSLESEIVTGYLWIFKASLTTAVSKAAQEEIPSEALEGLTDSEVNDLIEKRDNSNSKSNTLVKVISGGGEANLKFKAPIFNIFGNEPNNIKFKNDLKFQLSVDIPYAFNYISEKDISLFNVVGLENKLLIPIIDFDPKEKEGFEAFSIFAKYDINNIGGTSEFYKSLNIPENRFWYSEYSFGLNYKNYVIYYTDQIFSNELSGDNRGRLSIAFIKQF